MTYPYPIRVYDVRPDGHSSFSILPKLAEDELDRLQAFYKFSLDFTHGYNRAGAGELFWGITGFELKAGPAVLQPQVRDQDGNLILTPPGILLLLSWPGADRFPAAIDPAYSDRGVAGFTEGNGSLGGGFGAESYIGDAGGPFTVWASSDPATWTNRRVGSDAVTRLGWWDDHIVPNPIFQVMKKGGIAPPPVTGAYRLAIVAPDGATLGWVTFQNESAADLVALVRQADGTIRLYLIAEGKTVYGENFSRWDTALELGLRQARNWSHGVILDSDHGSADVTKARTE